MRNVYGRRFQVTDYGEKAGDSSRMMSTNSDLGNHLAEFGKKSSIVNKMSSSSNNCFSSSSEKMLNSSSSTSSSASLMSSSKKAHQLRHAMTSSSSCQELQQEHQQKQNEIFQENRNFSRSVSVTSNASSSSDSRLKLLASSSSCPAPRGFSVDETLGDIVSEPGAGSSPQELKFEQQRVMSSSKTKVSTSDGYTEEKMAATNHEKKKMSAGNVSYEETSASAALQQKMEADGYKKEKYAAFQQDQKQLKTVDSIQQQQRKMMAASVKLTTDEFSAEKSAIAKQEEKRTYLQGMLQAEKNVTTTSSSKVTFTSNSLAKTAITSQNLHQIGLSTMAPLTGSMDMDPFGFSKTNPQLSITEGLEDDIGIIENNSSSGDVEKALQRFACRMSSCVENLKSNNSVEVLKVMDKLLKSAWALPVHGEELGSTLCKILLNNGALDILMENCVSENSELLYRSAEVLEQCLSTDIRTYVVNNGLDRVVKGALFCTKYLPRCSKIGTGILAHLFKHSETTCSNVVRMGGLEAVLFNCRSSDVETLQHCAAALANLSLYGGPENQQAMIRHKVPVWLFPLAFQKDDNIVKYYACLAISSLVSNKEIEAAVIESGTLDLVERFVTSHSPEEFAKRHKAHTRGQSKNWLQRLVNVLESKREEARNLAAFHFAMEAGIKKSQGNTKVFHEVGAIEALKKVASSPNAIASKFAAQALQLIGEELPHKLSQQVPLWTAEDVREWVKQIGFSEYCSAFNNSRVDGDLLLQLTEEMLNIDIGIKNGILRKRFLRELNQLKKMADYTSCDSSYLNQLLLGLGPEFCQYTYQMLHSGVQRDTFRYLSEDQLVTECGVDNSIHRLRIAHAIQGIAEQTDNAEEERKDKPLDVFVSYRRYNGSQLASLLKVHLQLRGFSVFIDVERLEAGKFDNNLLSSIKQAKHFLLVLTPNALERCIDDNECKDWVHKEIVEALSSQCNIIPILDNFQWPEPETLPEDMRAVCYFNGVRWIHDYQDACVDKLERFLRGEMNSKNEGPIGRYLGIGPGTPGTPSANSTITPFVSRPHQPYQRSTSTESSKGYSDKECCNGGLSESSQENSEH